MPVPWTELQGMRTAGSNEGVGYMNATRVFLVVLVVGTLIVPLAGMASLAADDKVVKDVTIPQDDNFY